MIWDLIATTQARTNGNLGFTQGVIQTSRTMSADVPPYSKSVKDLITEYTQLSNSVDVEFTPDKQVNIYYPGIGQDKTDLLFSYPGNIKRLATSRDATKLVNYSIDRGSGNGNSQAIEIRQDAGSQSVFKLHERVDDYPSVPATRTDMLDSYGDETLRTNASPLTIPDVILDGRKEPYLGAYWIGDRVRFSVPNHPAFSILDGQTWRINEIDVTIDQNDHEEIRLKVAYS